MTRPLILGIAGLAGLGLWLARRGRDHATADIAQHPAPPEGDDGIQVDAGLHDRTDGGGGLVWCRMHGLWEDVA